MAVNVKALKGLSGLRKFLAGATENEIEEIIQNLKTLQAELHEQSVKNAQERDQILAYMKERNISPEVMKEYFVSLESTTSKSKPVEAKYRYVDLDGVERVWSGRGRLPLPFHRLLLSNGKKKDDYLINKSDAVAEQTA